MGGWNSWTRHGNGRGMGEWNSWTRHGNGRGMGGWNSWTRHGNGGGMGGWNSWTRHGNGGGMGGWNSGPRHGNGGGMGGWNSWTRKPGPGSWSRESSESKGSGSWSAEHLDPCYGVSCTGHTGTNKGKGRKPMWDRKHNGHDDNWTNRGGRRGSDVGSCCNVIHAQSINFN